jgi:hypothetical protein
MRGHSESFAVLAPTTRLREYAHTAEVLKGSRIVDVRSSGTLVVEKDGETSDVFVSGYPCGSEEVVVSMTASPRRARPRTLAHRQTRAEPGDPNSPARWDADTIWMGARAGLQAASPVAGHALV